VGVCVGEWVEVCSRARDGVRVGLRGGGGVVAALRVERRMPSRDSTRCRSTLFLVVLCVCVYVCVCIHMCV